MTENVIKSFLVGLGFDIDEAGLAAFNRSITGASVRIVGLATAVQGAVAGVAYGIGKISQGFEDLGYEFHLVAPAINKMLFLRQEMIKAYANAGLNLTRVIQASIRLNMSLAKTKFAFEALYKSVAVRFFPLVQAQSERFRKMLYDNMPMIQDRIESVVKFLFQMFEAIWTFGERAWSVLKRLHEATNGWSTIIMGIIAAWKFLKLEFLATPLGIVLALGAAILALYDDLETFYEGGDSFINWGSEATTATVGLVTALAALGAVWGVITAAMNLYIIKAKIATAVQWALDAALDANPIGAIVIAIGVLITALTVADAKWKIFGGHIASFFSGIGGKVLDFIAGGSAPNIAANVQNNPAAQGLANPVSSSVQNASNSLQVHQQTSITVQASADANATGQAVAGQQTRVNADMARNTKTAAH